MHNALDPIGLLLVGVLIGYLSSRSLARLQHRHILVTRIAEEYFTARKAIAAAVSKLTDLDLTKELSEDERRSHRDKVAAVFYKHYDVLSVDLRTAIVLLHVSLDHPARGPFEVINRDLRPIPAEALRAFVKKCSDFKITERYALAVLNGKDTFMRDNQVLKLHARNVVRALCASSSVHQLVAISREATSSG